MKSEHQKTLVGDVFGVYGVELGAYSAMKAAYNERQIKVLVVDSVPGSATELLNRAISNCVGLENGIVQRLSRTAVNIYLFGRFDNRPTCDVANGVGNARVLLLSGADAGPLKDSTASIQKCFPVPNNVESRTDLPLSGFSMPSATGEQGEAYDRIVIDFFDRNLR